jgi:hypothetical protein
MKRFFNQYLIMAALAGACLAFSGCGDGGNSSGNTEQNAERTTGPASGDGDASDAAGHTADSRGADQGNKGTDAGLNNGGDADTVPRTTEDKK